MGLATKYDRQYPHPKAYDYMKMVIPWHDLGEFIEALGQQQSYALWIHNLVVCIAYRSPGPPAMSLRDVLSYSKDRAGGADGSGVDCYLCYFMLTAVPRHMKNIRSLTIDCGFWTKLYPNYSRLEKQTRRDGKKLQRYTWDSVFGKLFQYFPSCAKQVNLMEHWLTPQSQLVLYNVKALSLRIGITHGEQFLNFKLPMSIERFDLMYDMDSGLSAEIFKTTFADCRRIKTINVECKGGLINTHNTDWLPASVVEFGRNYSETGHEAKYYISHANLRYLHVHLRNTMHPAAALYYKHMPRLTRLHIVGPTKLKYNHEGLYEHCPLLQQLHVEDMSAEYIAIMCNKFPLRSLVIERVGYSQGLSMEMNELEFTEDFYHRICAIPDSDTASLRFFYCEISPLVQVQNVTEYFLHKFEHSDIQVFTGNRVLDRNPNRFKYIDSPWRPVRSGRVFDGFMEMRSDSLHQFKAGRIEDAVI